MNLEILRKKNRENYVRQKVKKPLENFLMQLNNKTVNFIENYLKES